MEKNYQNLEFIQDEVAETLEKILIDPTNIILGIGQTSSEDIKGGLVIDYMISNGENRRFIIGYTELGSWIEYNGKLEITKNNIIDNNPFE